MRDNRVLLCGLFHALLCALTFTMAGLQIHTQENRIRIVCKRMLHLSRELE